MPSRTETLLASPSPSNHSDSPDYISSSLASLSRSKSTNTFIVKSYKAATQLYLTRRFKEAWDAIAPAVGAETWGSNGKQDGVEDGGSGDPAPIAQSSHGTRTKVWVFWLSLVHAVVELGTEEGKAECGGELWKVIAKAAKEGGVWSHIIARGYGGVETEVDAEVVVNVATLLLEHMPDQRVNQARLEVWLAGAEEVVPYDGMSTPMSVHSTSSPKALQVRQKILEVYALHVLPAVGEWEQAREFLEGCGSLDEERREAFLEALKGLREEKNGVVVRERELKERREREEAEESAERERRRLDDGRLRVEQEQKERMAREKAKAVAAATATVSPAKPTPTPVPGSATNGRPVRKAPTPRTPPASMYTQFTALITTTRQNLNASPRLIMFILAFLILAMRRDIRLRLRRALADSWQKVQRTVGMGMKVSYV
ncbi:hypothetical protein B0A48_01969 [Cryoendolithus antarcticus]|uniref:Peroxin 26 n=1 Tax=Cryoendolithus antarcticus TaxID=1507870 RepID=A0A1V8TQU2_9PEZI|nr:hypothetical protein B0A48_01969 [Cryoendolithus antarcticus]